MTTTQTKNRGFTLVELLIVIVIIAILTVVSLVAYNGLQNQAKTSAAKSAAETVGKKAELYNTEEGSYPKKLVYLTGGSDGGTAVTVDSGKSYYLTPTSVEVAASETALSSVPAKANTVFYKQCNGGKGARIFYHDWQESSNPQHRDIGDIGGGC